MPAADPFDLARFVDAQETVFETALGELRAGRKRSHWMWFVFPQLRGLGSSSMATFYGIASLDEARAYLAHPVLGPRLALAADAAPAGDGRALRAVFGAPDDLKFRSSMTLFALAEPDRTGAARAALDRCCGGEMDPRTLALLGQRA